MRQIIKISVFSLLLCIIICCDKKNENKSIDTVSFTEDIKALQQQLHIPGLAIAVSHKNKLVYEHYLGYSNIEKKIKVDTNTIFPISSLTKIISSVLAFQQIEAGELSLKDSLKSFVPLPKNVDDNLLVEHILSHTSEDTPGTYFNYSNRYGILTNILQQSSKKNFQQLTQEQIFSPLQLKQSYLLDEVPKNKNLNITNGYLYKESTFIKTPFQHQFSASTGMFATIRDWLQFDKALNNNILISSISKKKMFKPYNLESPYGLGIFTQTYNGLQMIWGYGQSESTAVFYLKIPAKDLTFVIFTNSTTLTNPFRLIHGNCLHNPFVISFLKHFVFKENQPKNLIAIEKLSRSIVHFYKTKNSQKSISLFKEAQEIGLPKNYNSDVGLFIHLVQLQLQEFDTDLNQNVLQLGHTILKKHPNNPYANLFFGYYFLKLNDTQKAKEYFKRIVTSTNYSKNWYTEEAEKELKNQN